MVLGSMQPLRKMQEQGLTRLSLSQTTLVWELSALDLSF
jgi:hypothetical protein